MVNIDYDLQLSLVLEVGLRINEIFLGGNPIIYLKCLLSATHYYLTS